MLKQFGVVGDPIQHSLSPTLHKAAYDVLGLDWQYDRYQVASGRLEDFVDTRNEYWYGLSVTMPLKEEALAYADEVDELTVLSGACNTLVFSYRNLARTTRGFNTDIMGLETALHKTGWLFDDSAWLFGAGATARSAVISLYRLGFRKLRIVLRTLSKAKEIVSLCETLGVSVLGVYNGEYFQQNPGIKLTGLVVNSLPNDAEIETFSLSAENFDADTFLFEIAYGAEPSAIVRTVHQCSGTVGSGLSMLVEQAVAQLRLFYHDNLNEPLPQEDDIVQAMKRSIQIQ